MWLLIYSYDYEGLDETAKSKHIGVRRIGEFESSPFYNAMKLK